MPMTEDLSVFFDVTEHATRAVLDNVAVEGIFDNEFEILLDGIETRAPAYTLPTASCRRATQSSLLRIAEGEHIGNRYRVRSVQPDGTGVTVLVLELLP